MITVLDFINLAAYYGVAFKLTDEADAFEVDLQDCLENFMQAIINGDFDTVDEEG